MSKTLYLSPPSFDGFDGGAGARYQARRVYNGVSIGKGHLAEAKAAVASPAAGAQGAFSRKEEDGAHVGSHCGTNDPAMRDELLPKATDTKNVERKTV